MKEPVWSGSITLPEAGVVHNRLNILLKGKKFALTKVLSLTDVLDLETKLELTGPGWIKKNGDSMEFVLEISHEYLEYKFNLNLPLPSITIYDDSAILYFWDPRRRLNCHVFVVQS